MSLVYHMCFFVAVLFFFFACLLYFGLDPVAFKGQHKGSPHFYNCKSFLSETNLPFLQDANFRNNMIKKIIQLL